MKSLQEYRDAYAHAVVQSAGSASQRLIAAFASTPREHYLGPGPWHIFAGSAFGSTASDDPRQLYQDVLVEIDMDRGINNGQPSLHALCLAACAPAPGESVLHIGAGGGYYTAILAVLVGPAGSVLAYEIEADLAARARANLGHIPNVRVIAASACDGPLPQADVIYVNAGATHPPDSWLDALNPGGRLVFPLTSHEGYGVMLQVTRRGTARYHASALARVAFIPCAGARDDASSDALATALARRSVQAIRSLRRGTHPDDTAWCALAGSWLSTAEPQ